MATSAPLWVRLDTGMPDTPLWRDGLAARLWIWLICMAKRANRGGAIRFSYPVASHALAWRDGRRLVRPTTKQLRRSLQQLAREGHLILPTGDQRRAQGGAQGWFPVEVCYWGLDGEAALASGTGSGTGQGTGPGRARAQSRAYQVESREEKRGKSSRHSTLAASEQGLELARHLLDSIRAHTPSLRVPGSLEAWGVEFDRMLRLDGRSEDEVRRAIAFAHATREGSFWRSVILSGASLRKHLDKLLIQERDGSRNAEGKGLTAAQLLEGARRAREQGR